MRKCLVATFAFVLLMFSCTGNKSGRAVLKEETPVDSVADSVDVTVTDTFELLITETPMPRAADAMFDDFIFNFLANKKLQRERIVFPLRMTENGDTQFVEKKNWKMEHFFMRQGYYTLFFNDDDQMALMKDTAVSEAVVEKILLKKNKVNDFHFRRIKGAWMLTEVRTMPIEDNVNASFLIFYNKFTTDSIFQVQSLNQTVKFVGPDPEDEFSQMEGVITPDTWEAFAPKLPSKMIYNIIYGKPMPEGNDKVFLFRGVANGFQMELRFKKVAGKWLLFKMTT